jgi:hypothetical protein
MRDVTVQSMIVLCNLVIKFYILPQSTRVAAGIQTVFVLILLFTCPPCVAWVTASQYYKPLRAPFSTPHWLASGVR